MLLLLALLAAAAPGNSADPGGILPAGTELGSDPPALDGALFRRDGQKLSDEGTRTLQGVATFLKKHPEVQVVILVPGRIRRGDPYWWTQQVATVEQFLLAQGLGPERIGLPLQPGGPVPPRLPSAPRPVQPPADLLELDLVRMTLGSSEPAPLVPVLPAQIP
ncbi:MAG TPA: hypothetical protein PKY30_13175 [Myxococcota bacterium]|nr:hypothetical protein [Myxococcota bacterium]HNH47989.1 hypothetical protein [Myxococcota bacterium]